MVSHLLEEAVLGHQAENLGRLLRSIEFDYKQFRREASSLNSEIETLPYPCNDASPDYLFGE